MAMKVLLLILLVVMCEMANNIIIIIIVYVVGQCESQANILLYSWQWYCYSMKASQWCNYYY